MNRQCAVCGGVNIKAFREIYTDRGRQLICCRTCGQQDVIIGPGEITRDRHEGSVVIDTAVG